MKFSVNSISKAYLVVYMCVCLILILLLPAPGIGEYDDYALAAVSIINEGDFGISADDVARYKEIFPQWTPHAYALSGRFDRSGQEMNWYFPTYSFVCIPMILILSKMQLPTEYAFSLTNLFSYIGMLWIVYFALKIDEKKKLSLLLLLSAGTIAFYYRWPSAEVFIAALLACSVTFWYRKNYKTAALFLAVASTLNLTILLAGAVMIFEMLFGEYCIVKNEGFSKDSLLAAAKRIIPFGCCFVIGLIPLGYNYYQTGYINMTASYAFLREDEVSSFARLLAYLFDPNFGMLIYYPIILALTGIMLVMALKKKNWRYIVMVAACIAAMLGYSLTTHINCGMTGIARYNAWAIVFLLFAVVLYWEKFFTRNVILYVLVGISCLYQTVLVLDYSYQRVPHTDLTPIARYIMNNHPALYNPLPSTFNSRVNHLDGGYHYETPIVYRDDEGYIRKILASEKDRALLQETVGGSAQDQEWFKKKLAGLTSDESYISVPKGKNLIYASLYTIDTPIVFCREGYNASEYKIAGISGVEDRFTWTDGDFVSFDLKVDQALSGETVLATFNLAGIFGDSQRAVVNVNDQRVCETVLTQSNLEIPFAFEVPESGLLRIEMECPDAISPYEMGVSNDSRTLALAFRDFVITIPEDEKLTSTSLYTINTPIVFCREGYNASEYKIEGISGVEDRFTWTDSNFISFEINVDPTHYGETAQAIINLAGVFNDSQRVLISVAGKNVYESVVTGDNLVIAFDFEIPESGILQIEMECPDAISPYELGMSDDRRMLALALRDLVITTQ